MFHEHNATISEFLNLGDVLQARIITQNLCFNLLKSQFLENIRKVFDDFLQFLHSASTCRYIVG